jgi:hypothetical protein
MDRCPCGLAETQLALFVLIFGSVCGPMIAALALAQGQSLSLMQSMEIKSENAYI